MDDALVQAVALLVARPLVEAMGGKAWRSVRGRWAAVLGRTREDGEAQAAAELDASAGRLRAGVADPEQTRDEWERAVRNLLGERPDLLPEVRALIDESGNAAGAGPSTDGVRQRADVGKGGISVQSGTSTWIGNGVGDGRGYHG